MLEVSENTRGDPNESSLSECLICLTEAPDIPSLWRMRDYVALNLAKIMSCCLSLSNCLKVDALVLTSAGYQYTFHTANTVTKQSMLQE